MNLEAFIQKDMSRFIKRHEPEVSKSLPVRQEDMGIVGKIDYERHVRRALTQHRFNEATRYFNEAKQRFIEIPADHTQERKQYYRILQKCYKMIYDYVEDRHKTSRLLSRLDHTADVFDDDVKPANLKDQANQDMAMPTIEQVMFKQKPQMPEMTQQETISMPEQPPGQQEQPSQDVESSSEQISESQKSSPETPQQQKLLPKHMQPKFTPPQLELPEKPPQTTPKPSQQETPTQQPISNVPSQPAPKPKFTPPSLDLPTSTHRVSTQPTGKHNIQTQATQTFIAQAAKLITENPQKAKEKLIEARVEYMRSGEAHPAQLKEIEALERQIATKAAKPYSPPADAELFSSLYIQAVHAMHAGDYPKAAQLLHKRIQQAPYDVAAKIRYKECTEAIHGKTA